MKAAFHGGRGRCGCPGGEVGQYVVGSSLINVRLRVMITVRGARTWALNAVITAYMRSFPLVLPWLTVRDDDGSRGGCNTFYALSSRFEALLGCIPVLRFAGAVALLLGNGVQVCFR